MREIKIDLPGKLYVTLPIALLATLERLMVTASGKSVTLTFNREGVLVVNKHHPATLDGCALVRTNVNGLASFELVPITVEEQKEGK